ncbi:MAG TPA: ABC transporter ATP-binding protein [Atribacteraceae bacterium]|nr:ABC transporter ATP-binding protein [Atribacteraceae bacterium]
MNTAEKGNNVLLAVEGLKVYFYGHDGQELKAVDGVDFQVDRGKTLALVGESGCGKSVTSLSILRLIDRNGKIVGGNVYFEGKDLTALSDEQIRRIRGKDISMIFQEPSSALNPVYTIGDQIMEAVVLHQKVPLREARRIAGEMLQLVGIPDPEKQLDEYPYALSGGMKQRSMIAMALSCHPKLLIADEPTTSLDVTIQAQILELIKGLQKKLAMTVILITHDLGVVADMADRILVMYAGKVMESGTRREIFKNPHHPYTRGLLCSIPRLDSRTPRLATIPGVVPDPTSFPEGCRFQNRCPDCLPCCVVEPARWEISPGHYVYCHNLRGPFEHSWAGSPNE